MANMAICLDEFGGPEVLQWREVQLPDPGPREVLLKHTAIGLNFIDTYHRTGLYPVDLPFTPGMEAAGVVEKLGSGVEGLSEGDRVVSLGPPPGSYAEKRLMPADRVVSLPAAISDEVAAASMLKGLTAWYLLKRSYRVTEGDPVLLYAAAGGVGLIAAQWARALGARVIGVTSTREKADLALGAGCSDVVPADAEDFVERVRALSGGGVAAVYDSVGRETFQQSLDCLRAHGTMVTYGNATGPVDPVAPMELAQRGSLFLTRPVLFNFVHARSDLEAATEELFDVISTGKITIQVNQTYPLSEAAQAHRVLEARGTTGSTVLVP